VPRVPDHFLPELPEVGPATMIGVVLERSRRLCLQQYQKEVLMPTTYLEAYLRCGNCLSRQQLSVFAGNVQALSHSLPANSSVSSQRSS
jgi:hypothetical protein